ncbi:MAG: hypothetical protein ABI564_12190 [Ideonella sp.]
MKFAMLGLALALTACASGKPDLDVAQVEGTCAKWCKATHSSCAFDGAIIPAKTAPLDACQQQYITCIKTCIPR